jgi:hypothetical protein
MAAGALSVRIEGGKFALSPKTNSVVTFAPDGQLPSRSMHIRVRGLAI